MCSDIYLDTNKRYGIVYINNSNMYTTSDVESATTNKLLLNHAVMIPIASAAMPVYTLSVAYIIAGNVITVRVTYGR